MFYFLEFSCPKIESWLFLFCVFSGIFSFSCSLYVTYYCGCPFLVKICSLTSRYIENQDQENTDDYRCLLGFVMASLRVLFCVVLPRPTFESLAAKHSFVLFQTRTNLSEFQLHGVF